MNEKEREELEREELRELQDRVIIVVVKKGLKDSDIVIDGIDKKSRITLQNLRMYIYPEYKTIFQEFLED